MAELLVDIDKIGANTEAVTLLLRERDVSLVAVMKGCMGEPRVAAAMLAGGAVALADSRDADLRRLREAFPRVELHRIGLPDSARGSVPGDLTYISSWTHADIVTSAEATGPGPRRVMLQVETGDEREGVPADKLLDLAERVTADPRLELAGVSTNYACLRGAPEGIAVSVEAVAQAARLLLAAGIPVPRVSGGNSSVLWLVANGQHLPPEITELRCGEALLLGHDALYYRPLPGCSQDACRLRAEVVEEYTKPSTQGTARRLVLAAGRRDLGAGSVRFLQPGLREVGRSADYLVVEAGEAGGKISVGMTIEMIPDYGALVSAWMSPYVEVRLDEH